MNKYLSDVRDVFALLSLLPALQLQLFAETQTTLLNQPGNDLSPEMKTYYHRRLIDNAEPNLVYDQFASKYPIPKGGGKTIEFRRYTPLRKALTPLTEGVTPAGNKLNVTAMTATVDQYGDFVEISDMLEMTAIDRNVEEATKLLGSQAGRTMDTITREVVCAGTNKMFAPKVASDGTKTDIWLRKDITAESTLTPAVVRKAVAKLKRNNSMPINGSFVWIIHPDITCDLTGDPEWVESHKYASPEEIYNGEIGRIGNSRFVESTEAKIVGPGFIFGAASGNGVSRMTLHTRLDTTGSTDIYPEEEITAEQAAELTQRISGGETVKIYVGGNEATISTVTAGTAGTGKFTVQETIKDVEAGEVICGYGAGADGSAIYCSMLIASNAYGTTDIEGMGLEHIVKQRGSAGTADPLNQRSTTGWKATKVAERLVEEYMIRVEHSSREFGYVAESN